MNLPQYYRVHALRPTTADLLMAKRMAERMKRARIHFERVIQDKNSEYFLRQGLETHRHGNRERSKS